MAKFMMTETILQSDVHTARFGTGTGSANNWDDKEVGKIVKYLGDSRFGLTSAGDPIEGYVTSVEVGTADGYTIGGYAYQGRKEVTFDGLQATPGTGTVAVGDFVVTGTVVAKGTALTAPVKVCKATNQPGATVTTADNTKASIDTALAAVVAQLSNSNYLWKVVSLGSAGTGAVGTTGIIERV